MDRFFGIPVQTETLGGMSFVLLLSVLLGGLVGLEREIHAHPAGLRTHILVCLGSCLMTLVSVKLGRGSEDRIAAQVVSGVGFLGAGAIIREGASVKGLTTAASIWATAGIGIALAASPFFAQLAVVATLIVLLTLWWLNYLEDWLEKTGRRVVLLNVVTDDRPGIGQQVVEQAGRLGVRVRSYSLGDGELPGTRSVHAKLILSSESDRGSLIGECAGIDGVLSVRLE